MAPLAKLNSILILFCFCFVFATYSPLARWLLTSQHLINNNFEDLTGNGNLFQSHPGYSGAEVVATASCGAWHITEFNSGMWCGHVNSITSSTPQYGISVWMKNDGLTSGAIPIEMGKTSGSSFSQGPMAYYGTPTIENFQFDSAGKLNVPFPKGTWLFFVFYWTKGDSTWNRNIISPGVTTITLTDSSFPGEQVCIGYSSKNAYYYEVQVFTSAAVSAQVVTLYDINNHAYVATTATCSCGSSFCHSEMGCLVTDACQCPTLCVCSDTGVCSSCKDTAYDTKYNCKCKTGYDLEDDSCVLSNFYVDHPLNCAVWSAKTVCTQCEANYYLYNSGNDVSCVACAASCSGCSAASCFLCASLTTQQGTTCRIDSIGYQLSFSYPNSIIISFAHPLPINYVLKNLQATKPTGEAISTSAWTLNTSASTLSKIQITTDLDSSQLPININFDFEVSS